MRNILFLFIFLMSSRVAEAADFSGSWQLDAEASQAMDAILELQDVSWAKRKLAEYLDHSVKIVQSGDRLEVTFTNVLGEIVQELTADGQPHTTKNPAGFSTSLSTMWEGEALISTGAASNEHGASGTVVERRSLSADGQTMTLLITVTVGGQQASVRRVFRHG